MKLLVTGGCGFIGTNFIKYWFDYYPEDTIINLDLLTYASCKNNHNDTVNDYIFVEGDICNYHLVKNLVNVFQPDIIINFAAESHNDRAIINPTIFYRTNVLGTQNLLEVCRETKIRFHHISTCEVYGDMELDADYKFNEDHPLKPNTPYSSSKAASDLVVLAYYKTFGLPITISRCCNNYGPYQFTEKMIPLFIYNLINYKKIVLFENSNYVREWIHVLDHCTAINTIIKKGKIGEVYNIGTGDEKSIEEIADILLSIFNEKNDFKEYVSDRLGHDKRYLLDSNKIKSLGWSPSVTFDSGIKNTIIWYLNRIDSWEPLIKDKSEAL